MMKRTERASYVLVSVAYNEERQIGQTINCVIRQTILPKKWIIVDDSSTDRTAEIVKGYSRKYPWIQYERLEKASMPCPTIGKASFAYARAMARGRERLAGIDYDFIANLDADISLEPKYYERVMEKALSDPQLGITGGGAYSELEDGTVLDAGFIQTDFVGGPLQFFRKRCLDDIDGYHAIDHADVVAVYMARMKGWNVLCFPEIRAIHHGQPENTLRKKAPICFMLGKADFVAGTHPLFFLGRCLIRSMAKPLFLAGISMLAGYIWAPLSGMKVRMPKDLLEFMRKDQKAAMRKRLGLQSSNPYRECS